MSSVLTFTAEDTKTTVLVSPSTTAAAKEGYVALTAGSLALNVRTQVVMGNAADVVLTLKSANDATGTGAVDFLAAVPLYVDGVKQTSAITYTVADATGDFVVDFCVDPALIPDDKFVGVHVALSNAANLVAATAIERTTEKPSA